MLIIIGIISFNEKLTKRDLDIRFITCLLNDIWVWICNIQNWTSFVWSALATTAKSTRMKCDLRTLCCYKYEFRSPWKVEIFLPHFSRCGRWHDGIRRKMYLKIVANGRLYKYLPTPMGRGRVCTYVPEIMWFHTENSSYYEKATKLTPGTIFTNSNTIIILSEFSYSCLYLKFKLWFRLVKRFLFPRLIKKLQTIVLSHCHSVFSDDLTKCNMFSSRVFSNDSWRNQNVFRDWVSLSLLYLL